MANQMNIESKDKLNQFNTEFAKETGIDISQYNNVDKGNLTSRQNGYVGGYIGGNMTKKLIEIAQQNMTDN